MAKKIDYKAAALRGVGLIGGNVGSDLINNTPFISSIDPKWRGLGKLAVGFAITVFGGKNALVAGAGDGLMGAGASEAVKAFIPGISGIGDTQYYTDYNVKGSLDAPSTLNIKGTDDII